MAEQLYLGVDGGGTGCRARVEDAAGRVLGEGSAGPASLRLGAEAAGRSVIEAAGQAASAAGLSPVQSARLVAGIALAGVGRKGVTQELRDWPFPYARVRVLNDAHAACLGAHAGQDGAVVIAGTGSAGYGIVAGRTLTVGGYGFPVSDDGSGAEIGLRAVRRALQAHDGRRAATPLLQAVMSRFGDDPFEVVDWMEAATATDYAALAPLVSHHAKAGDAEAAAILSDAARGLAGLVRALHGQGAPRLSLVGGLACVLGPALPQDAAALLSPAQGDSISGAILFARQGVG